MLDCGRDRRAGRQSCTASHHHYTSHRIASQTAIKWCPLCPNCPIIASTVWHSLNLPTSRTRAGKLYTLSSYRSIHSIPRLFLLLPSSSLRVVDRLILERQAGRQGGREAAPNGPTLLYILHLFIILSFFFLSHQITNYKILIIFMTILLKYTFQNA